MSEGSRALEGTVRDVVGRMERGELSGRNAMLRLRAALAAPQQPAREEEDGSVAAQVRLTHRPITNPMYPKPICDRDSEEWPCVTELQVREGLRARVQQPAREEEEPVSFGYLRVGEASIIEPRDTAAVPVEGLDADTRWLTMRAAVAKLSWVRAGGGSINRAEVLGIIDAHRAVPASAEDDDGSS